MKTTKAWLISALLIASTSVLKASDSPFESQEKAVFRAIEKVEAPEKVGEAPPPDERVWISKREWRGARCGVKEPAQLVFRKRETWETFWTAALAPYSERLKRVPAVDFTKDMVVGVFLGENAYPDAEIAITSIKSTPSGELVVRTQKIQRLRGDATPKFPVQPYDLRAVPRFNGPVTFKDEH